MLSEPACLSVLESDHVHSLILILLKNIEAVDDNEGRKDMLRALSVMRLSQEMMDVVGPVLLARLGKISTSSESLTV